MVVTYEDVLQETEGATPAWVFGSLLGAQAYALVGRLAQGNGAWLVSWWSFWDNGESLTITDEGTEAWGSLKKCKQWFRDTYGTTIRYHKDEFGVVYVYVKRSTV